MRMQKPSAEFKIESYEIDAEHAPADPSWNAPPAEAPDTTPPTDKPPAEEKAGDQYPSLAQFKKAADTLTPEEPAQASGAPPAAAESFSSKSNADIAAEAAAAEEARKCEALEHGAGADMQAWLDADCE
jgi:hypothetical protein